MADFYNPHAGNHRPPYSPLTFPSNQETLSGYDTFSMNRTPQHGDAGPPTQLPRIWDDGLNSLMHRTVHAYDLVVTYERDSCGGTRWSSENIEYIRATGIYLHRDVDCLKRWRVEVAKYGVQDDATAEKIQEDIESVRAYCEHLQQLIKSTERVPLLQRITRDDVEQTRTQEGQGKESLWADREPRSRRHLPQGREEVDVLEDAGKDVQIITNLLEMQDLDPIDAAVKADWGTPRSQRFVW